MKTETKASPRWEYSRPRAALKRDGEIVARLCTRFGNVAPDDVVAEVLNKLNSFDALVDALERVQREISDGATLVDAAAAYCNNHNTSEALVGVLELRRVVDAALALARGRGNENQAKDAPEVQALRSVPEQARSLP